MSHGSGASVDEELRCRRQGDVIELKAVAVLDGTDVVDRRVPSGLGVVITQTCDLVRSPAGEKARPYVTASPLLHADADTFRSVQAGRVPTLAAAPWAGDELVANLEVVQTIDKTAFAKTPIQSSPRTDQERRRFAYDMGRKFSRAAIPDEAQDSVRRLRMRLRDKAGKASDEGTLIDTHVRSVRVEPDPDWTSDSIELRVVLLIDDLPELPDREHPSEDVMAAVEPVVPTTRKIQTAAKQIQAGGHDPATTVWLWSTFAECLAELCEPIHPVVSVTGEVVRTSSYGVDRFWASDDLDLDYLSND